ncbi:hypothetical protein LWI29_029073 [Acer saccharum]|uniref:Uncharacterized protein n=1 Tax=Acer saccharum TaxID=4024 RepID=A0AA39SYG2_ACESA|nr:hypothetical protein LWI29_029073 [Acer saccharum]
MGERSRTFQQRPGGTNLSGSGEIKSRFNSAESSKEVGGRNSTEPIPEAKTCEVEHGQGSAETLADSANLGIYYAAQGRPIVDNTTMEGVMGYSEVSVIRQPMGTDSEVSSKGSSGEKNVRKWKRVARGVQSSQVDTSPTSPSFTNLVHPFIFSKQAALSETKRKGMLIPLEEGRDAKKQKEVALEIQSTLSAEPGVQGRVSKEEMALVCVLLWCIWENRNALYNNGLVRKSDDLIFRAGLYLEEFRSSSSALNTGCQPGHQKTNVLWSPPPPGIQQIENGRCSHVDFTHGRSSHVGFRYFVFIIVLLLEAAIRSTSWGCGCHSNNNNNSSSNSSSSSSHILLIWMYVQEFMLSCLNPHKLLHHQHPQQLQHTMKKLNAYSASTNSKMGIP